MVLHKTYKLGAKILFMAEILGIFPKEKPVSLAWSREEIFAYLEGVAGAVFEDGTVNYDALLERYGCGAGKGVYIWFAADGSVPRDHSPVWQEVIFASANPEIGEGQQQTSVSVQGVQMDSYTIQAMRRKIVSPSEVLPNVVHGFLVKDNYFLLGIRGGSDTVGVVQPIPAGHVAWEQKHMGYARAGIGHLRKDVRDHFPGEVKNPFLAALVVETFEEAGTVVKDPRLYGIFNQQGNHINRLWFFRTEPVGSLEGIAEQMRAGRKFYLQERARHGDEALARKALGHSPYPADTWENSDTLMLPYNGETLLRLLADKGWTHQGKALGSLESLPVDAYIAGVVDFGEDFKREAEPYLANVV